MSEIPERTAKYGVTLWFNADVGLMKSSPFNIETPYGKPSTIGRGNAFVEADIFRAALEEIADEGFGKAAAIAEKALAEADGPTPTTP